MLKRASFALLAMALPAMAFTALPAAANCPGNPSALGVSRVVEIDTTGGPGFGFEHFKEHDFLEQKEVVLTFDDGPWPGTTPMVLKALADQCTKATFFIIGKHAMWHPEILHEVVAAGHTIASHTFSHRNLGSKKLDDDQRKAEIEMGISAVRRSLGENADKLSAFIRFPALQHPPEMMKYVGERNIGVWSTDLDSYDFKMRNSEKMVSSLMHKLDKRGKGILLMHDFQKVTAHGVADLLSKLKAGGYKVVHVTSKATVKSLPEFDEKVASQIKGPVSNNTRPTSSIVKTISQEGK